MLEGKARINHSSSTSLDHHDDGNTRGSPTVGAPPSSARKPHDPGGGGTYHEDSGGNNRNTRTKRFGRTLPAMQRGPRFAQDGNAHMQTGGRRDLSRRPNISSSCVNCAQSTYMAARSGGSGHGGAYATEDENDTLHEVAHGLHFASIALLGFLVLEVSASWHRFWSNVGMFFELLHVFRIWLSENISCEFYLYVITGDGCECRDHYIGGLTQDCCNSIASYCSVALNHLYKHGENYAC